MGGFWWLLAGLAAAQTPAERWETVETEHFRVHFPVRAEEWGLEAAGQLEEIRERVNEEVGWVPPRTIDVVIVDPNGDANGSAWPFAGAPRMLLWATAPQSDSVIGHYRSWGELLLTHEYAHLVHLLRDSRSPGGRILQKATGIAPITRKAPRWCIEGYATVVEGRLSGFGRPNADFRALLIRRLAQEGRLPAYGELNAFGRYQGGSFAYLVGSAYLEWLEERQGRGSLKDLWARLTARKDRNFDDAFKGVYGDSPAALYARFVAEMTHQSLEIEQERPVDPATLWLDSTWYTGAPVVSLDGTKLAAVTTRKNKPSTLKIWSLEEPDAEAEKKREEARKEALEKDPDDVLAVAPKHPPRKTLDSRTFLTRSASDPRWMPDGDALLFSSWQPTKDGRRGPDLFLWEPESGAERRVTRGQGIRHADPFPDGTRALAVRQDWGRTHLVVVDLESGEIDPLTEPTLDVLYDQPRVAPAGERVAWMEHRGGGWQVVVHDAGQRSVTRVGGIPGEVLPFQIAWSPDGERLMASMGRDGFIEVYEIWGVDGGRGQLTQGRGGAVNPAPAEDALFYLSMDDDGLEIHRLAYDDVRPVVEVDAAAPVVRPTYVPGPEAPEVVDVEPKAYGLGRTEWRPLIGGAWSPSQGAIEAGVRLGDIVGRRDLLLVGSYGADAGVSGGKLAFAWRGLPVELAVEGFAAHEPFEVVQRAGGLVRLEDRYRASAFALGWTAGASYDQSFAEEPEVGARSLGYLSTDLAVVEPRSALFRLGLDLRGQAGTTDAQAWKRGEVRADLALGRDALVGAAYTVGAGDGSTSMDRYRLGGVRSSALPEIWQWGRVSDPAFALGRERGAAREELSVRAGPPEGGLVYTRHRLGSNLFELSPRGAAVVAVRGGADTDALPFQRLPAGRFEAGVGCRIEDSDGGWAYKPCQSLEDYSAWLRVGWDL